MEWTGLDLVLAEYAKCLHTWAYPPCISIVLSPVLSVSFEPVKTILPGIIIIIMNYYGNYYSQTLLYGHVIIRELKMQTFSR